MMILSGSHAPIRGSARTLATRPKGCVRYEFRDNETGDVFAAILYNSSDATPPIFGINASIVVPPANSHHGIRIDISLDTRAYVGNLNPAYQTAVADCAHTFIVNLDALTPAASTLRASGFNYGSASSGPEPSTWPMLVAGIALSGTTRRARLTVAVAASSGCSATA